MLFNLFEVLLLIPAKDGHYSCWKNREGINLLNFFQNFGQPIKGMVFPLYQMEPAFYFSCRGSSYGASVMCSYADDAFPV